MTNARYDSETFVWVFKGDPSHISGVFSTKEKAEQWISTHRLSGALVAYPLDEGVYDWAVRLQLFVPKDDFHTTPQWIGGFMTASQDYYIYEDGIPLFR